MSTLHTTEGRMAIISDFREVIGGDGRPYTVAQMAQVLDEHHDAESADEARWEAHVAAYWDGAFHTGPTEAEEAAAYGRPLL